MPFLTFTNICIEFREKKLIYKIYILAEALPTMKTVEFMDKKDSAKAFLNKDIEAFVVYMSFLSQRSMII